MALNLKNTHYQSKKQKPVSTKNRNIKITKYEQSHHNAITALKINRKT